MVSLHRFLTFCHLLDINLLFLYNAGFYISQRNLIIIVIIFLNVTLVTRKFLYLSIV